MSNSESVFLPSVAELYGTGDYTPDPLTEEQAGADDPSVNWWTRKPSSDPLPASYAVPRYFLPEWMEARK